MIMCDSSPSKQSTTSRANQHREQMGEYLENNDLGDMERVLVLWEVSAPLFHETTVSSC
jgi:hypothetical protein